MNSPHGSLVDPPVLDPAPPSPMPASRPALIARIAFPLAYLVIAAILAALFAGILKINNGTFIYTLDDPYIHLALSDQIRHGNYGLYPGTHAAPSSSILFPFLLAVASGTPVHPYLPLILNISALFFTVEIMRRLLLHLRLGDDSFAQVAQAAALVLMALCFNLIGVVFTGLEHSLHIAAVAATVYGLVLFLDRGKMPAWLPAALVLSPLLRYEGVALSVGALLVLALRGRVRTAIATFIVIVLLVGGFSVFLVKLGLSPLPSSILVKSTIAAAGAGGAHGNLSGRLLKSVDTMIGHPIGLIILLIGVAAAFRCSQDFLRRPRDWTSNGLMSLALLAMVGGHALAGRFGWLDRYEDYLIVGVALTLIYVARSAIRTALAADRAHQRSRYAFALWVAAGLLIFGVRYWHMTLQVPLASNNIYEQQLQMHRFIVGYYKGPVAVNDLGQTSYRNPYPILDLAGLGSEKARRLLEDHAGAGAYQAFVASNGVHLAVIYDEWFENKIPEGWHKVATLSLSRRFLSAAASDVQFYATDDATAGIVRSELTAFQKTLPPRVKLTIY